MNRTSNFTHEGIHDNSERTTWIIYNILVILSSVLGDTTILIATIKYNAIKLHRIIVVMIQHMAVSDILLSLFKVLPMTATLIANGWVLGEFVCCLNPLVGWLCNPVTIFITCFLATSKLLIVMRPLRAIAWSKEGAHVACCLVWFICLLNPMQLINYMVLFQRRVSGTYLNFMFYECAYDHYSVYVPLWLRTWFYIIYGLATFLIMLVTCVLTSLLLVLYARRAARRQGRKLHWQGLLTTALTATTLIVSYFPFFIMKLTGTMFPIDYTIASLRIAHFLPHINILANFFIYSIAVRSFRQFLMSRVSAITLKLRRSGQHHGTVMTGSRERQGNSVPTPGPPLFSVS